MRSPAAVIRLVAKLSKHVPGFEQGSWLQMLTGRWIKMTIETVERVAVMGFMHQHYHPAIIQMRCPVFNGINRTINRRVNAGTSGSKYIYTQVHRAAIAIAPRPTPESFICVDQSRFIVIPERKLTWVCIAVVHGRGFTVAQLERVLRHCRTLHRECNASCLIQISTQYIDTMVTYL